MKVKNLKVGYKVKGLNQRNGYSVRGTVWSKNNGRILILSPYGVYGIPKKEASEWKFKLVKRL